MYQYSHFNMRAGKEIKTLRKKIRVSLLKCFLNAPQHLMMLIDSGCNREGEDLIITLKSQCYSCETFIRLYI